MERSPIQPKKQGNTKSSENRDWGWESWTEFEKEWGVDIIGFFHKMGGLGTLCQICPLEKLLNSFLKKITQSQCSPKSPIPLSAVLGFATMHNSMNHK